MLKIHVRRLWLKNKLEEGRPNKSSIKLNMVWILFWRSTESRFSIDSNTRLQKISQDSIRFGKLIKIQYQAHS